MAVSSGQVTVGTTPTLLSAAETDSSAGEQIVVNNSGAVSVYLGGPTVSTATGYALAAGVVSPRLELGTGEALYAVVAAATSTLGVLRTGA